MRNSPPPPLPDHALEGSVAATLRGLASGVRPSDVWRSAAFALLRLNPKECEALALVFEDEGTTEERRLLVLDLLAGAGSFEAQVVIRRLLALSVARRDNRLFATFVQRLAIVESPDGPTLRFLMSVYAESRSEPHDVRAACAYALGAAAGQALASGEPDAAVRASDVIRRDLLTAAASLEKCALLTALGNAGVPSDVILLTRFTQDADGAVRAAAALSLRKLNVPEARAQLIALVGDRDFKVAQSALAGLTDHKLDETELEKLAELVLDGRSPVGLDLRILRLVVAQRPRVASSGRPSQVENALRLLLGRVEAVASSDAGSGSGERRVTFPPPNVASVTSASGSLHAAVPAPLPALAYSPLESQIVGPMPGAPVVVVPRNAGVPTMLGPLADLQALGSEASSALPDTRREESDTTLESAKRNVPIDETVIDRPLTAIGGFALVQPGDSVETVRARMIQLGLDPNARTSIIPKKPQRR